MGFLLSLVPFSGIVAPFIAPRVARFGYKRTFMTFWYIRKIATAFLLLIPWVLSSFGLQATTLFVGAIMLVFALGRAIGETGKYPWLQEFVPANVRGKYSATSNIFTTLTGFVAVTVAGWVVGRSVGLSGYMILMGIGVIFGFAGVWMHGFIPGGAPDPHKAEQRRDLREAISDKSFVRYLVGVALIILATGPMESFLPLFMQEQVGLAAGNVVLLQTGTLLGGLISSYWWGWTADRYGSKPVALTGIYVSVLLPIFWMVMPRFTAISLPIALVIAVIQGIANTSWLIGSGRLLFVGIVPAAKKNDYMAVYYASIGIIGGISQLIGGTVLDLFRNLSGRFLFFTIDPFTPLFLAGLILPLLSTVLIGRIPIKGDLSVGEFAGLFWRGNPFLAMQAVIRYHWARDEYTAVHLTEQLAQSKSRLTIDELLVSLDDPRFNVRFEAILAIARMPADERLIEALTRVLNSHEPALSVVAAWALGRMGDDRAIAPLRDGLNADYRSIRVHSTRALGTLGDERSVPLLLRRLEAEPDPGLQIAYASALGQLRAVQATDKLLALLAQRDDAVSRLELALALARIVGEEAPFIQLWRQMQGDVGTAVAQTLTSLEKRVNGTAADRHAIADLFAHEDVAGGIAQFSQGLAALPLAHLPQASRHILPACAHQLAHNGTERLEYLLLALHVLML
jgi:MFS family permease